MAADPVPVPELDDAARADPAAALAVLAEVIRAHRGCGFEPCETCLHPVPGEGSPTADVMVVGEAPGASEDKTGRPFVGRSGQLLDLLLAEAGLARADVFIANVLKARPPGNRDPKPPEVAHHRPWLQLQLDLVRPRVLIPLGRHALKHFAPAAKISEVHGRLVEHDGRALYPMYHPAAALYDQSLRATLFEDARGLPAALERLRADAG